MAQLNYPHPPADCTPVERLLFTLLKRTLPENYFVWFEPTLFGRKKSARPDFVVLGPEIGLVIIEVKDWSVERIRQANRDNFELVSGSDLKVLTNPEKQAEGHFRTLSSQLAHYQQSDPEKYQSLLQTDGPHRGRLAVPISYLIAFPNVTRQAWQSSPLQLYHMINTERVLLKEDLAGDLTARLQAAPPFQARLDRSQLTTLKWMLYPESRVPYTQGALFTLDPDQLGLAQLDTYLPPQAQKLARKPGAKLVRGVVGSGKSLILLYRAKFLSELNPHWRVLILTYNKSLREYLRQGFGRIGGDPERVEIASFHQWCRSQLLAHDRFPTPQDRRSQLGLITRLLAETNPTTFEASFLADEFNWIKERLDYRRWADYLDPAKVKRVGRGRGLGRNEAEVRAEIYRLFELYQAQLAKHHLGDWADVPVRVLQALDAGRLEPAQYHAVLIDEAQDFAPAWFRVAFRMVKPETNMLFIVGDGAQKIYGRDFTWKELGIGITAQNSYVLKRSYRSTREIIEVALEAIRTSQTLLEELRSAGDGLVEPERSEPDDPHGPLPVLLAFESPDQEQTGVTGQILSLLQQGYLPQQIVILHRHRRGQAPLAAALRQRGVPCQVVDGALDVTQPAVKLATVHTAKGLEFEVVFICGLEAFKVNEPVELDAPEFQQLLDQERKLLYVGLTRARRLLYLTYSGVAPAWIIGRLQQKLKDLALV